jgi:hypothetical protein
MERSEVTRPQCSKEMGPRVKKKAGMRGLKNSIIFSNFSRPFAVLTDKRTSAGHRVGYFLKPSLCRAHFSAFLVPALPTKA